MTPRFDSRFAKAEALVFILLDPIPYGLFVGALVFDAVYAQTAVVLWFKAAAWLIAIGLVFAIVPRLINLVNVCFPGRPRVPGALIAFGLNLLAIVAAIVNAFVHSRDAYGVMPEGLLLSIVTVLLMVAGRTAPAWPRSGPKPTSPKVAS